MPARGRFFATSAGVQPTTPPASPSPVHFHLLAKPTGAICNLDCKYCFFLSKEMLYPGSRFRMADELLETYVRQLLESQAGPEVCIAWQGGEPTLMGLDLFKRAVEYAEGLKKPGRRSPRPSRPTARAWTTNGRSFSRSTIIWLASAWTARARCTTPTAWTRAGMGPSTA
jgi:sulfatase maturation enzyme AslB (radical SAM superfamily)